MFAADGVLPGWVARGPASPRKAACRPGCEHFRSKAADARNPPDERETARPRSGAGSPLLHPPVAPVSGFVIGERYSSRRRAGSRAIAARTVGQTSWMPITGGGPFPCENVTALDFFSCFVAERHLLH